MNRYAVLGYVFLVLSILLWAGNSIVGRASAGADIPPVALNFWRWTTALAIFLPVAGPRLWRQRAVVLSRWRFIVCFAVISVAGFNTVFYVGLQHTTAIQCSLIQSILPVLVLLLGLVVLREGIRARQWWGVLFSVGGAALIVARGDVAVLRDLRPEVGDLWCLGAVFIWALQAFLMRWKPRELDILAFMTALCIVAVAVMLPVYLWETWTVRPMPVNGTSVLYVLYVGLFASVLGTTMFNEGTFRVGAATAGYFGNLYPIFSGLLAVVLLGEALAWFHVVGAMLVLAGIYLATMTRRETRPAEAAAG